MENNEILAVCVDNVRGVQDKFSSGQTSEEIRHALIDINGGSAKISPKTFRPGNPVFELVQELLPVIIDEGIKTQNNPLFNLVEYRNLAEGDTLEFYIDTDSYFAVATAAKGIGNTGAAADNNVYIGGDGFSYWNGSESATSIRPGTFLCCQNNDSYGNRGIAFVGGDLYFCCGGNYSPRTNSITLPANGMIKGKFATRGSDVYISGDITFADGTTHTSDKNLKNTISQYTDAYDLLFDSLQPVTFKYNYGKSGRLHSGFVAQDVLCALTKAGLTTKDFAAYVEIPVGDDNIERGLRYDEFVALNTWQIQKLKQRVTALEETVAHMQKMK